MKKTGFKALFLLLVLVPFLLGNFAVAQEVYTTYVYDGDVQSVEDEPAPEGFKPVYISHFGRHGSRFLLSGIDKEGYKAMVNLTDKYGVTEEGRKLYFDVNYLHSLHDGKTGTLSVRGGFEHRGIGRRMAGRFSDVFTSGRRVHARASIVGRCRKSMANFTDALIAAHPGLKVKTTYSLIAYRLFSRKPSVSSEQKKIWKEQRDSLLLATFSPDRISELYFSEKPDQKSAIELCRGLYAYARIIKCIDQDIQNLDTALISKYFTEEEMAALTEDSQFYYSHDLLPYSLKSAQSASGLLKDIINKADDAMKDKEPHAADLRFGHDSGFVPLCSLMGLEGFEPWVAEPKKIGEAVPMAANIQLIFYKNDAGDVIVKILHCEKETLINSLEPWSGSYYKWTDLRAFFLSRIK